MWLEKMVSAWWSAAVANSVVVDSAGVGVVADDGSGCGWTWSWSWICC